MSKEVVKNTKLSKINAKVNNLKKEIADGVTLIQINQSNTDKQSLERKNR